MTASGKVQQIRLPYGESGVFACELDASHVRRVAQPQPADLGFRENLRNALQSPLDFPPLSRAILAEDRVVLAVDFDTPAAPEIIAELWETFEACQLDPANLLILQPQPPAGVAPIDPRSALPVSIREQAKWRIHDPSESAACAYLATSSNGVRIYLSRAVIEADMVISIGRTAFDPVLGYRGTNSVLYPGLSDAEAIRKTYGQGHDELSPDNDRPLRQMIDEAAWLLGSQFTIQVVQGENGSVAHIQAGALESVYREARQLVSEQGRVELPERVDMVVASIDRDPGGHGWRQIGAAVNTARSLVANGGKIVILSEVQEEPGPGVRMLQAAHEPADVIQPLRSVLPDDLIPATQMANAVDWSRVYLLSRLDPNVVEDLFLVPVADASEVERLIAAEDNCVFLGSAQNMFGCIQS